MSVYESVPEPHLPYFLGECMKPHTRIQVRLFCYPFTDEKTEATRVEGVESGVDLRPGAKAAFSPVPRTAHTSFFFELCCPPRNQKPQLFSNQNVFRNKPSGAFPHRTGMSLRALLAVSSLLISVKMEVFEVC